MEPSLGTSQYDSDFKGLQELRWLPWVGRAFPQRQLGKKLLVVGESHYYRTQAQYESWPNYAQLTRDVVSESLVDGDWTTPTLRSLPTLLFGSRNVDRQRLWGDCAFYNFVQRLMNQNVKERPTADDFITGWKVFPHVVKVLRPSHCLFIGVSAANSFDNAMAAQHLSFDAVSLAPKVGDVWPRVAHLRVDGISTKLVFVHHLSRCKNVDQWQAYLQTQHADLMTWIEAESYTANQ